jgi:phage tail-like protein
MTLVPSQRARKLVIPDVVGLSAANAAVMLRNTGFGPPRVHYVESYEPEDAVTGTDPIPGQMVASDTEIRLYVSKRSFVEFLPSVYQQGGAGIETDFLRRMLRVVQHTFESLRVRADTLHEVFRPGSTDPEFLPWLASWIALTLEPDWPTDKKRRVIRRAAALYPIRGTARALIEMVEIFTGHRVRVRENEFPYRGFRVGQSRMSIDTIVLPKVNLAHTFVVELPVSDEALSDADLQRVHRVIHIEKPAHTLYCVQFTEPDAKRAGAPMMRIGVSSRIATPDEQGAAAQSDKQES